MLGDAQAAYLFQCGDEELFAVSPDKAGTKYSEEQLHSRLDTATGIQARHARASASRDQP